MVFLGIAGLLSAHPSIQSGHKGMFLAAKVMAATALDLFLDKEILIKMKKEFKDKLKGYTYKSGIPQGQKPPLRVKNNP